MIRLTDKHAFFYTEWPSNFWHTNFTWKAFGGSAYYLYMVLAEGNVKLEIDKYDSKHPEMATFIVAR